MIEVRMRSATHKERADAAEECDKLCTMLTDAAATLKVASVIVSNNYNHVTGKGTMIIAVGQSTLVKTTTIDATAASLTTTTPSATNPASATASTVTATAPTPVAATSSAGITATAPVSTTTLTAPAPQLAKLSGGSLATTPPSTLHGRKFRAFHAMFEYSYSQNTVCGSVKIDMSDENNERRLQDLVLYKCGKQLRLDSQRATNPDVLFANLSLRAVKIAKGIEAVRHCLGW
eukprot:GEMP01029813.1.p1 GENE.GEMP01029813.1~~GEMP01029813.1.p1  ORF type:complete len:233 (+),score=21.18 GEMP01029813.1:358-1056(+)